ncbi:sphingosine kinase 1-like [Stigmatopora argus]
MFPDHHVQVRMDRKGAEHSNTNTLYGEFTTIGNRKVRCAVSLTDNELVVQRLNSVPEGRNRVSLSLKDCIGCRTYRKDETAGPAAYLAVYFYPLKRRWVRSGLSRRRVEQCFRLSALQDPRANLDEADKWAQAVRERCNSCHLLRDDGVLLSEPSHPCRIMLLVNPQSGKGQALTLYNNHVQRMLDEAGVLHMLVITEHQNHARELVREVDLSQWDALVIVSGDGLLFEVINGLMERSDWEEAIHTPLGILPGGSGNALAASIHYYAGASLSCGEELLVSCGLLLCKGVVSHMDLVSVHLASGARLFSFLSLAWGFVADVDVESEKYRRVGAVRFTLGTLMKLASLRVYKGKLAYLPVTGEDDRTPPEHVGNRESPSWNSFRNSCHSNNTLEARGTERRRRPIKSRTEPSDSLLPPLDEPLPGGWVPVPEEDFVLVLAIYQSHLAMDLLAAPGAALDDGVIHLFYVKAGISRAALLRLFLAMEKGAHLACNCPHMVHTKVRALRLEPSSPKGIITVDGEVVEYGPVQAEVRRGMARLISAGTSSR